MACASTQASVFLRKPLTFLITTLANTHRHSDTSVKNSAISLAVTLDLVLSTLFTKLRLQLVIFFMFILAFLSVGCASTLLNELCDCGVILVVSCGLQV